MKDIKKAALTAHQKLKGKIETKSKIAVKSAKELSLYYTPGVGAVSEYVAEDGSRARDYTIKSDTIAVISDGSAVLGLGNIGALGALPVMEGKCMLFRDFGGVNAFPIVLDTQDTEEIIATIKNIAPVFAGINLEDIAAPRCFEIEDRLKTELDIPVVHDDQHATALVVLAGLINAFKVARKPISEAVIVVIGAGAAGNAIARFLSDYGVGDVLLLDSKGIVSRGRKDLDKYKTELAKLTNKKSLDGGLDEAMIGADAVVGVSKADIIKPGHIAGMNDKPIVFALSNPVPEIMPDIALAAGAFIVATGRSDLPNQINNVLAFPGIFKGAIKNRVRDVTPAMRLKAAKRLAALVKKPAREKIIPSVFDKGVVEAIAGSIK